MLSHKSKNVVVVYQSQVGTEVQLNEDLNPEDVWPVKVKEVDKETGWTPECPGLFGPRSSKTALSAGSCAQNVAHDNSSIEELMNKERPGLRAKIGIKNKKLS